MTKKYKIAYAICKALQFVVLCVPMLVYVCMGIGQGTDVQRLTLSCTAVVALILLAVNLLCKLRIRSTLWIILLGIYICLDNIMPLLLCLACGTIADEFILTPLAKHYHSKYVINKEIDKRL